MVVNRGTLFTYVQPRKQSQRSTDCPHYHRFWQMVSFITVSPLRAVQETMQYCADDLLRSPPSRTRKCGSSSISSSARVRIQFVLRCHITHVSLVSFIIVPSIQSTSTLCSPCTSLTHGDISSSFKRSVFRLNSRKSSRGRGINEEDDVARADDKAPAARSHDMGPLEFGRVGPSCFAACRKGLTHFGRCM